MRTKKMSMQMHGRWHPATRRYGLLGPRWYYGDFQRRNQPRNHH